MKMEAGPHVTLNTRSHYFYPDLLLVMANSNPRIGDFFRGKVRAPSLKEGVMGEKTESLSARTKSSRLGKPRRGRIPRPTVLVIDDDWFTREMVAVILSHLVMARTIRAATNAQAFRKIAKHTISAVISDLVRPRGSGFEFLTVFKEMHPGIPVIICSGNAQIANARRAKRLGAFAFLAKPYKADDLAAIVRNALESSAKEARLRARNRRKRSSNPNIGAAP